MRFADANTNTIINGTLKTHFGCGSVRGRRTRQRTKPIASRRSGHPRAQCDIVVGRAQTAVLYFGRLRTDPRGSSETTEYLIYNRLKKGKEEPTDSGQTSGHRSPTGPPRKHGHNRIVFRPTGLYGKFFFAIIFVVVVVSSSHSLLFFAAVRGSTR